MWTWSVRPRTPLCCLVGSSYSVAKWVFYSDSRRCTVRSAILSNAATLSYLFTGVWKHRQTNNLISRIAALDSLKIERCLKAEVRAISIIVVANHTSNLNFRISNNADNVFRRRILNFNIGSKMWVLQPENQFNPTFASNRTSWVKVIYIKKEVIQVFWGDRIVIVFLAATPTLWYISISNIFWTNFVEKTIKYPGRHALLLFDLRVVLQQEICQKFYGIARSTHDLSS